MGRKTYSVKKLIILVVMLIVSINAHSEAIDLRTPCALDTQSIENLEKPNSVKKQPTSSDNKPEIKKTASKSNKFGFLKLLIPGTLR